MSEVIILQESVITKLKESIQVKEPPKNSFPEETSVMSSLNKKTAIVRLLENEKLHDVHVDNAIRRETTKKENPRGKDIAGFLQKFKDRIFLKQNDNERWLIEEHIKMYAQNPNDPHVQELIHIDSSKMTMKQLITVVFIGLSHKMGVLLSNKKKSM